MNEDIGETGMSIIKAQELSMSLSLASENVVYLALELSRSTWLVAARLPGVAKPSLHRINGGDAEALLALIAKLRTCGELACDAAIEVVCCFEAGRDGFWLHRLLSVNGVVNHVDTSKNLPNPTVS